MTRRKKSVDLDDGDGSLATGKERKSKSIFIMKRVPRKKMKPL